MLLLFLRYQFVSSIPSHTKLFKEDFPLINTSILDVINLSLLTSYVLHVFIKPLLKNAGSHPEVPRIWTNDQSSFQF